MEKSQSKTYIWITIKNNYTVIVIKLVYLEHFHNFGGGHFKNIAEGIPVVAKSVNITANSDVERPKSSFVLARNTAIGAHFCRNGRR